MLPIDASRPLERLPHSGCTGSLLLAVNNTARQLLETLGYIAGKDGSIGSSSKGGGGSKGKKR